MFEEYDDILSLDDLCKALHISRNTAKSLIDTHQIKAMKIGNSWKIAKKYVIEYVEKASSGPIFIY